MGSVQAPGLPSVQFLPDKMRRLPRLGIGQAEPFFAESDALHKEGHISCERAHGLQSLLILFRLSLLSAVYAVPVLTGRYRHSADGEILVELVKCRGAASPPCDGDGGSDLHHADRASDMLSP